MILNNLPTDHPDRNKPLLGAFYKRHDAKLWKEIKPNYKISKSTFNQLGEAWTNTEVFSFSQTQ